MSLCECGCKGLAPIAKKTATDRGHKKGEPIRFINGHQNRNKNNPAWRGGKKKVGKGYILMLMPNHPRATKRGYVREHILVAEKAMGFFLPPGAEVHHVDGNPANNAPHNLVVCDSKKYHFLLHKRERAYRACGHTNWLKCKICKKFDDPINLHINPNSSAYHQACSRESSQIYRRRKENV